VRESFAAAQNPPPQEIGWLATHAAIAGDYDTARRALALAPVNPEIYVPQALLDELLGRTAGSSGPRARLRLARRRPAPRDDDGDWPEVPDSVPDPAPPPADPNEDARKAEIRDAAISWVNAVALATRQPRVQAATLCECGHCLRGLPGLGH